jgi:hypothetical protein
VRFHSTPAELAVAHVTGAMTYSSQGLEPTNRWPC